MYKFSFIKIEIQNMKLDDVTCSWFKHFLQNKVLFPKTRISFIILSYNYEGLFWKGLYKDMRKYFQDQNKILSYEF